MGRAKEWLLHQQEIGVTMSPTDAGRAVCDECIADDGLRLFVSRPGPIDECGFCGATERHGLPAEDLFEYMAACLHEEWDDPINCVGWSGRDGGWMGASVIDSFELLEVIGDPFENDDLRDLFATSFEHEWCQRDPYSLSFDQRLVFGWELFSDHVRYRQRFLFLNGAAAQDDPDTIDPSEMLAEVGRAITNVQHHLLRVLPAGSSLHRGRDHGDHESLDKAADLGSPPVDRSRSTRMSPAGFPVFYGSEDEATVLREARPVAGALTAATWRTTQDLVFLDLAGLPPVPSLFDMTGRVDRTWLRFLHQFASEVSQPAGPNPDVDYVPTQIFTEFVRAGLRDWRGEPVMGIRFRSSLQAGGVCWVLFVAADGCADEGDEVAETCLVMDPSSLRRYRPSWSP